MATFRLKDYFFKISQTATKRGSRFRTGDKPTQSIFEDWIKSSVFKTEADDRALEDSGAFDADRNGHVVAATDIQAKANVSKATNRTIVAQPSQLPTVTTDSELTISGNDVIHSGDALLVETNGTTRNIFNVSLSSSFSTFLNELKDFASSIWIVAQKNTTDIVNLTGTVSQNTIDIATLSPGGIPSVVPIGAVSMWLSDSALPVGYLTLDGSEVDQVTYAALFGLMGSKYNNGIVTPGSFRLPNMSNRVPRGFEVGGTITNQNTTQVLGGTHGEDAVFLSANNIPPHTHSPGDLVSNADSHTHPTNSSGITYSQDGFLFGGRSAAVTTGEVTDRVNGTGDRGNTGVNQTSGTSLEIIPQVFLTNFIMKAL